MRSLMTSGVMAALLGVLPAAAIAHPNDPTQSSDAQDQDQTEPSQTSDGDQQQGTDQNAPELDRFVVTATSGPRLGITVIGITPELRSFYGAPRDRGVVVAHVEPRSPASRAGLRVGDILIGVGSQPVSSAADVLGALTNLSRGEQVPLMVIRAGQAITLQAKLPSNKPMSEQDDC